MSVFLVTSSSFMHDWSCHLILSQWVPLHEKYITVIYALGSAHEEVFIIIIILLLIKNTYYSRAGPRIATLV